MRSRQPSAVSRQHATGSRQASERSASIKIIYTTSLLVGVYLEAMVLDVILRSKATKNLIVVVDAEILRSA
jgi:hypothetical protein